ncbi:hypothetical protein [Halohasta litchfieldiae]|nr:hypothetical protein [Halohasta litchfieldiae]
MKQCSNCGSRLRRKAPENEEYGIAAVDGRRYPDDCPDCGAAVSPS